MKSRCAAAILSRATVEREALDEAEARAAGKVRQEGKDYVMVDGDVVEFKFNV